MARDIHFRVSDVVEVGDLIFQDKQELDDFINGAQAAAELAFGNGVENEGGQYHHLTKREVVFLCLKGGIHGAYNSKIRR